MGVRVGLAVLICMQLFLNPKPYIICNHVHLLGVRGGSSVFIFSILGMQLFGGQFNFADEGIPRHNYNNFIWAFITTFRVITRAPSPQPASPLNGQLRQPSTLIWHGIPNPSWTFFQLPLASVCFFPAVLACFQMWYLLYLLLYSRIQMYSSHIHIHTVHFLGHTHTTVFCGMYMCAGLQSGNHPSYAHSLQITGGT